MQKNKLKFPWLLVGITSSVAFLYALIRYHFFGTTTVQNIPLYLGNKVMAINGVVFFIVYLFRKKNYYIGGLSYVFILGHLTLSLLLLNPHYFPNFFDAYSGFTGLINLSLLFGVLSFLGLWIYHQIKKGNTLFAVFTTTVLLNSILTGAALHLFFMGIQGWVEPSNWKGGLPPITLIALLIVAIGFFRKDID